MSKYKFAVVHDGFEDACGNNGYGIGDGNSSPSVVILGMFEEEEEGIDFLAKLEREVEEAKPEYWIPGNPYLMRTYSIRDYSPDLGWTDQAGRCLDDAEKHRMNLERCGLRKRRRRA